MNKLNHKFRKEVLVPYLAITDNVAFFNGEKKHIITSDGVECICTYHKSVHILTTEGEKLVEKLYGIGLLQFIKSWFSVIPDMGGLWYEYMKLEEVGKNK